MKFLRALVALLFPIHPFLGFVACGGADPKPVGEATRQAAGTPGDPEFDSLLVGYHERYLQLHPLSATSLGDARYNDRYPNYLTQAYKDTLRAFYSTYADSMRRFNRASLSEEQAVSHDVLGWECELALLGLDQRSELLPIDQFNGPHLGMGQFASGQSAQPFVTPEDYEEWLRRVDGFLVLLDTTEANMRRGIAQEVVLPRALTEKLLPQLEDMADTPTEEHLYYSPVNLLNDSLPADYRRQVEQDYRAMVEGKVKPAFRRLSDFVREEYLPASRTTSGIGDLPGGEAAYDLLVREYTTTDMDAEEIFALGESEVERLTRAMDSVKTTVGFTGTLPEFFEHVRTREELTPFTEPGQVIANFDSIHERMKPQLEKLFDRTPETPFEVRRTEAFREASASAEYNPGSLDGTRPGVFYVPIPDVSAYNLFSDEDLFLHEAIPGHHYQISLTQENESLPDFRRGLWYSAYGEGWALYSESLGEELGLYTDPYQYFGMLSAEMHRAIRLVVDVGLHRKGWTREEAIRYSLDHEAESEAGITAEIERYMAYPGQALSYKVGQLKIRELRRNAEEQLGEAFDVAEFHDLVLEAGCLPLAVLEQRVGGWLDGRAGR